MPSQTHRRDRDNPANPAPSNHVREIKIAPLPARLNANVSEPSILLRAMPWPATDFFYEWKF